VKRFEGKVALVTGAGSGIGKATAARLTEEGATVIAVDVQGTERHCDISDPEQVAALFLTIDKLDVLCNVAGILRSDRTHELSLEHWDRIIKVNLTGTFLMCRAAIPKLLETKGNIVNCSSTAALGSHPWMAAYAASKGGVISLTKTIAVEYVKQGLRANCVCPGGIATPLHMQFKMPKGADLDLLRGAMPLVPQVGPEYAASVIAFLASDDAKYITGTEIRADGGALS
jgi:NAD(P)-dependent dehydrogenase (short-subunit alcohol dehydrogenase family)